MKRFCSLAGLCFLLVGVVSSGAFAQDKIKTLIIDGQNNHGVWPQSTAMMKSYLEGTGRFTVDVERTQYTWKGGKLAEQYALDDGKEYEELSKPKADPTFQPKFSDYDLVVSNFGWGAAPWPESTQKAFVDFVGGGGGFVVVHAADNSFGDWKEYNEMIGLGGWGDRNEKSGPYVYYDKDEKLVRDTTPGRGGSHGPQHAFPVIIRDSQHPITKGLPQAWMHATDELYQELRGPAENMNVLATAFAAPDKRGTGRHEPMLMTIGYGEGRVFHTPMGHSKTSFQCVGFITTFLRGCEWAATGEVTLTDVPDDFPSATESKERDYVDAK